MIGVGGASTERIGRKRRFGGTPGAGGGGDLATSQLEVGTVFTQNEPTGGLTAGKYTILGNAAPVEAQHLQGFGTGAVWPTEAGAKNWSSLDRLFGTPGNPSNGYMRNATKLVLYTLGCPKWMKVAVPGTPLTQPVLTPAADPTNDFSYTPPHRSQYTTFANFIAEVITRYTQITHVVVWNELKGFYRNDQNRWWYEGYTEMYNAIYTAVKAGRPAVKVGGPYPVFNTQAWEYPNDWADNAEPDITNRLNGPWGYADKKVLDVIRYWLQNASGADFFCFDLRNSTRDFAVSNPEAGISYTAAQWNSNPDGGTHPYYWPVSPWAAFEKQRAIMTWFRGLATVDPTKYARSVCNTATLPVWMTEWYFNARTNQVLNRPGTTTPYPDAVSSIDEKASVGAEGLRIAAEAGYATIMEWRPEGDSTGLANPVGLWRSSDGAITPYGTVQQAFAQNFGPGTVLKNITIPDPEVSIIASATKALLINKSPNSKSVLLDGSTVNLTAYQVVLVNRP